MKDKTVREGYGPFSLIAQVGDFFTKESKDSSKINYKIGVKRPDGTISTDWKLKVDMHNFCYYFEDASFDEGKPLTDLKKMYNDMIKKQTAGRSKDYEKGFRSGLAYCLKCNCKVIENEIRNNDSHNDFTADQALNTVNTTYSLENYVYKQIKEAAKQGRDTLEVRLVDYGKTLINNLMYKLATDGYYFHWDPFIADGITYLEITWAESRSKFDLIVSPQDKDMRLCDNTKPHLYIPYLK